MQDAPQRVDGGIHPLGIVEQGGRLDEIAQGMQEVEIRFYVA
ncbi:hypothetical protein MMM2322_00338 [Microbacterium sp. MM2322]